MLETIKQRWVNTVIVAATGPSLTDEVVDICRDHSAIIAVNDAYKVLPFAPIMFACDSAWWRVHGGCPDFKGEKWATHNPVGNDNSYAGAHYGVHLVAGKKAPGFSTDPTVIHWGDNSGFMAVNMAILSGAATVLLVGFDMQPVGSKQHFFGTHPAPLRKSPSFHLFRRAFESASADMPNGVAIINCTPNSALKSFPFMPLQEALDGFGASTQGGAREIRAELRVA